MIIRTFVICAFSIAVTSTAFAQQPLSAFIDSYVQSGDGGANVKIRNASAMEYDDCTVDAGDGKRRDRWHLPQKTVLDAKGTRSYPTFLFTDREQKTPPTANSIRNLTIRCTKPILEQFIQLRK